MRVIVEIRKNENPEGSQWSSENIIEIEQKNLQHAVEKICTRKECRYPLLALRLLFHVITGIDATGKINISARQLSKSMNAHYDTITKCLKYLREIEVIRIDRS